MITRALIATNLRRIRRARRFSLERLAKDAGVDPTLVWKLEQATANPTIEILDKLAATLGVRVGDLLKEIDPDPPKLLPMPRRKLVLRA